MEMIMNETLLEAYRINLYESEKSPLTVEKYIRDVTRFLHFSGMIPLTREIVLAYKRKLQEDCYAARSINSMLSSLNSFFAFTGWHVLKVKVLKIQREVYCPEEKELTKAEYERLCRAAKERGDMKLELIIRTLCGTGIRVGELKYITAEAVRRSEAVVTSKGKTRNVYIVPELKKRLLQYMKQNGITFGPVFLTCFAKPVSRICIWRAMKNLCRLAHVDPGKVFPHNLRHLFARVFYGLEKDIVKLADILGHSSIDTTRIYIISTGAEHRKRIERMQLVI